MMRRAYVTTSVYALAHQLGMGEAMQETHRQIKAAADPLTPKDEVKNFLPCARTIVRLATFAEVQLHIDGGATYLGMARSRAFHAAYKSGEPAWITIDDDIEVTTATVGGMLAALDDVLPRIVLTPYALRAPGDRGRMAVNIPNVRVERTIGDGVRLLALEPGHGGGLGFVGMNRAAMQAVVDYCPPELAWVDEDGAEKRALFYEKVEDGLWFGEDISFFRFRIPRGVSVELLLAGHAIHAGVPLDLSTL